MDDIRSVAEAISFRQLRLFESVGRLSSVRQGSDECNLSQPAVSQAIQKLEEQLAESLLERRANGSYLTPMGEILHKRVQRFQQQFEDALLDLGLSGGRAAVAMVANRISRSQVRGLIAVIEHASMARAAEVLGLTQASLQRAARDLEGNLRKTIFHRTANGVMVTANGVELGRRLKLATQEIVWGIGEMWSSKGLEESQITIGALPFGGSMLVANALDDFIAMYPRAKIRIVTEGASEMIKSLRGGDVDMLVGLVQDTKAADLADQIFAETPYKIVCRSAHPLAARQRVSSEDLNRYAWIVGHEGSSRRAAFEQLFAGGQTPSIAFATSSLRIARHLLNTSDRLALMTTYELEHERHSFVALDGPEVTLRPAIGVTLRSGWEPTSLHKAFIARLEAQVREPEIA